MVTASLATAAENKRLRQDPRPTLPTVSQPLPGPQPPATRQWRHLLDWVMNHRRCANGCEPWPPAPDSPQVGRCSRPETDRFRLERWARGKPLTWNFIEEFGPPRDLERLSDAEIEAELERIITLLGQRGVVLDVYAGVPLRLLAAWLLPLLQATQFDLVAPGSQCHIGCAAECDGCFQQQWCDVGREVSRLAGAETSHH